MLHFIAAQFLHLFFPNLTCKTAYELFYSKIGQHTSVGNYWNDPHHQVSNLVRYFFVRSSIFTSEIKFAFCF